MLRQNMHVDPEEAEEIIRLAAERRGGLIQEGPTVDGLAEALGLPASEVERLLAEVRQRRTSRPGETSARSFGDRSAALSAGLVLALVLVVLIGGFGFHSMRERGVAGTGSAVSDTAWAPMAPAPFQGGATVDISPMPHPPTPLEPLTTIIDQAEIQRLQAEIKKAVADLNRLPPGKHAEIEAKIKALADKMRAEVGDETRLEGMSAG